MIPNFTLFDPDIEPTDEQLALIMHEAGEAGRRNVREAQRRCREQMAIDLQDAMASRGASQGKAMRRPVASGAA